nr:MAG TPA: hypothetical protein [Caudoviricetes sp.]
MINPKSLAIGTFLEIPPLAFYFVHRVFPLSGRNNQI